MVQKHKIRLKYLLLGFLIGSIFPVFATTFKIIELNLLFNWENVYRLHLDYSLMKIVDLAPIVLALSAYMLGIKQSNLLAQSQILKAEYINQDKEIEDVYKILSHKNKDLDDITYGTTHDLKSTLRGISSLVSIMKDELTKEEQNKYQQLLEGRIVRMDNLLDGLMNYIRIHQKKGVKKTISVYDQIDKIKGDYNSSNITFLLAENIPHIFFDPNKFTIILRELIENSIKFGQNKDIIIKIDGVNYNKFITLLYSDNGPGILPEYRTRVFNLFTTLDNRDNCENIGMGLAIVKRTLLQEQGEIRILDSPYKGLCFELKISN